MVKLSGMKMILATLLLTAACCPQDSHLGQSCDTACPDGLECLLVADSARCDIGGEPCDTRICSIIADDVPQDEYDDVQGQSCGDGVWLVVRAGQDHARYGRLLCTPTCDETGACPFALQPQVYGDFGCVCLPWWPEM